MSRTISFDTDTFLTGPLRRDKNSIEQVAGTYHIVVHYLGGDTVVGDQFIVEPNIWATNELRCMASEIQDISQAHGYSIKVNDNVVGIHLQHVTYIELKKEI